MESSTWWSREQREFCVEQYYLNQGFCVTVRRLYCEKYRVLMRDMKTSCPSIVMIKHWVAVHEGRKGLHTLRAEEEERRKQMNKLNGSQWGRKTGENRIVRTESIDMGEQHQAIKWKQRDTKWSGPRPVNEKQKIEVPVVEEHPWWWYRQDSVEEEVKPDKKQVLKEKIEGEVLELIESLDAHGHAARVSALDSLRAALQRRVVTDLLTKHRATLADHVSRALRRGKDGERKAAAAIAPLLALQIGDEGMEDFVREVRPSLITTATDASASLDTRTECCSSLAVLCYLMDEDITKTLEVMRTYETIFSGSYLKEDGSVKVSRAAVEEGALHAAALDGWALLFSLLSPNHASSQLNNQAPSFTQLAELLEAASLEVRMAAGSALALTYETVTQDDNSDNALTAHVDALLLRLTELARDSHRFRAKKDLRIQRATFRHILEYFEEGEAPSTVAHIGKETAALTSWSSGVAYAALAGALGGALQVLAPHCPRLRAALQLPDEPPELETEAQEETKKMQQEKPKKLQRHLQNRAASKARDFTRNQNRDKRSAVLAN